MKRGGKAGGREDDGAMSPIPLDAPAVRLLRSTVCVGEVATLFSFTAASFDVPRAQGPSWGAGHRITVHAHPAAHDDE